MKNFLILLMTTMMVYCPSVLAVPQQIGYQGYLTDPNGNPLSTSVNLTFRLYESCQPSAPAMWVETHSSVTVNNGLFQVFLGSTTPLSEAIVNREELCLGVTVDDDEEMAPRTPVAASPYSLRARQSGHADSLSSENARQMLELLSSLPDADQDGHVKFSFGGDDCDDWNPAVYPGSPEICDGFDNNCDSQIDEGFNHQWYRDLDGDSYGDANCGIITCTPPPGYVTNATDCNDNNPEAWPGHSEVCDGVDNNCDGVTDPPGTWGCTWYWRDCDHDGYGDAWIGPVCTCGEPPGGPGMCQGEVFWATNNGDCYDWDPDIHPGAAELCDCIDNNCDMQVDENASCPSGQHCEPCGCVPD